MEIADYEEINTILSSQLLQYLRFFMGILLILSDQSPLSKECSHKVLKIFSLRNYQG